MLSSPQKPALFQHDTWMRRLSHKYGVPRAVLARQLNARGALEYEIAIFIVEAAEQRALALFHADMPPSTDSDLFSRAVRGALTKLLAAKEAADEAARQARYAETDRLMRERKDGQG